MSKHRTLTIYPRLAQQCSECNCNCNMCGNNSLDLHSEIEELKSQLSRQKGCVSQLEQELANARSRSGIEVTKLQDELSRLRDKYDRLLDSHKKMQKLNNNLEDKLITVVEKLHKEKDDLYDNVNMLTSKLSDASMHVEDLETQCARYQSDCNLAVQLLQCKPSEFVAHRLHTLPLDLQNTIKSSFKKEELLEFEDVSLHEDSDSSLVSHMPMSTFPPTAVFSMAGNKVIKRKLAVESSEGDSVRNNHLIPVTLIAKALRSTEEQQTSAGHRQSCNLCRRCGTNLKASDAETQTGAAFYRSPSASYRLQGESYMSNSFSGPPGVHKSSKIINSN